MSNEIISTETSPQRNTTGSAKEKNIADSVLNRINSFKETGMLKIPPDYSAENALKSAWLILLETKHKDGKPVLEACSKESVANCLLSMVTQGLNPVKKQCYFIPYGNSLQLSVSYMGEIALARRYGNVKDVVANVIYDKDEFDYEIDIETGAKKLIKHKQSLGNIDGELLGAYALVTLNDGFKFLEIMTMQQIRAAWNQGQSKGMSPAHKNFPGEMAKKTVIGRACKLIVNTSSDAVLMDDDETLELQDQASSRARQEIAGKANRGMVIDMDELPEEKNNSVKIGDKASEIKDSAPVQQELADPGF